MTHTNDIIPITKATRHTNFEITFKLVYMNWPLYQYEWHLLYTFKLFIMVNFKTFCPKKGKPRWVSKPSVCQVKLRTSTPWYPGIGY